MNRYVLLLLLLLSYCAYFLQNPKPENVNSKPSFCGHTSQAHSCDSSLLLKNWSKLVLSTGCLNTVPRDLAPLSCSQTQFALKPNFEVGRTGIMVSCHSPCIPTLSHTSDPETNYPVRNIRCSRSNKRQRRHELRF